VNHPARDAGGIVHDETRVLAPDGQVAATYHKRILALMDMAASFAPGKYAGVVELPFARIGLLVCKDAFFPEHGSGAYADADILIGQFAHPGVKNGTAEEARLFPSPRVALKELRYVSAGWSHLGKPFLAVNKIGRDGHYSLVGGSHATDAAGRAVADIGVAPGTLLVDFPLGPDGHVGASPTGTCVRLSEARK
jgi:predicted amidohydrolase